MEIVQNAGLNQGQLIIIGGAEDKQGERKILREFVRRAGGIKAKVAVMTVATDLPGEVGSDYKDIFGKLGVERVEVVDTAKPEDANDSKILEILEDVTGVYFTGGNQARITNLLKDTPIDRLLHKRYQEEGLVIAGTSAGAAMMPENMIVEGVSETNPRPDVIKMESGMGFMPGVIIDQHFLQRGRLGRLLSAVAHHPDYLGMGIDENTAVIVHGDEIRICGEGAVTIVDPSEMEHNNLDELLMDESLAICGVKLHILPDGYRFDLKTRTPLVENTTTGVAA